MCQSTLHDQSTPHSLFASSFPQGHSPYTFHSPQPCSRTHALSSNSSPCLTPISPYFQPHRAPILSISSLWTSSVLCIFSLSKCLKFVASLFVGTKISLCFLQNLSIEVFLSLRPSDRLPGPSSSRALKNPVPPTTRFTDILCCINEEDSEPQLLFAQSDGVIRSWNLSVLSPVPQRFSAQSTTSACLSLCSVGCEVFIAGYANGMIAAFTLRSSAPVLLFHVDGQCLALSHHIATQCRRGMFFALVEGGASTDLLVFDLLKTEGRPLLTCALQQHNQQPMNQTHVSLSRSHLHVLQGTQAMTAMLKPAFMASPATVAEDAVSLRALVEHSHA